MRTHHQPLHLDNRVVLITGGAGGIGAAAVRHVLNRGGHPIAVDLPGPALDRVREDVGARGMVFDVDITDSAAIEAATAAVVDRYGRIDVVSVNAGISGPMQSIRTMDAHSIDAVLAVNLAGALKTVKATMEPVVHARGHIVGSCSVASILPWPLAGIYGVTKAGLESLLRTLRIELAHTGVSVGAVYFGNIATPMMDPSNIPTHGKEMLRRQPSFMTRQITADQAAEAMIRNIEGRKARTWAPGYLGPLLRARGLAQLLDDRTAHSLTDVMEAVDAR